jgi:hypothetical protein
VVRVKNVMNNFLNQMNNTVCAGQNLWYSLTSRGGIASIREEDKLSLETIFNEVINMTDYIISIYSTQAPTYSVSGGSSNHNKANLDYYYPEYRFKRPDFYPAQPLEQKSIEIPCRPFTKREQDPLNTAMLLVEFPFGNPKRSVQILEPKINPPFSFIPANGSYF